MENLAKKQKHPKLKYIPFLSSFLMMPSPNQAKVSPIMEYSNNCPLSYY
jgi:hypothetical protein